MRTNRHTSQHGLIVVLAILNVNVAVAQRTIIVSDAVTCGSCRIASEVVATLRTSDAAVSINPMAVRTDSAGRYWVVNQDDPPAIFDQRGRFLRYLGRRGAGPGEYLGAVDIMPLSRDSILAIDRLAGRVTVLDSNLRPARTSTIAWPLTAGLATSSGILLSGLVRAKENAGFALHRVSLSGVQVSIVRSFGPPARPTTQDTPTTTFVWHLSADGNGGVWSLDRWLYRINRWSTDGSRIMEVQRTGKLIPSTTTEGGIGTPQQPPTPTTAGLWVDEKNSIAWVALLVPSDRWREAWSSVARGANEASGRQIYTEYLYTTVVEAISLSTWSVIARERFDGRAMGLLPGGRLALYLVDEQGESSISVRLIQLVGQKAR